MVREGRVLIPRSGSSPNTQFASDYRVKVCAPGALVAAASSSTTITVHPGHGFSAGDKFIVGIDKNRYRTVSSVTSTTVVVTAAVSVASGEFLINIGADTGSSGPVFDSTPVQVYLDSGYVSAPANSTVSTDSVGRYRYWHKGIARWELVLDTTGEPVAFYTDTDNPADEDQVAYGVRYAHLFADGGTGTDDDPFTLTGSNPVQAAWDDMTLDEVAGGGKVVLLNAAYDLGSGSVGLDLSHTGHYLTGCVIEGLTTGGFRVGVSSPTTTDLNVPVLYYSGTGAAIKLGHYATSNSYWSENIVLKNFKVRQTGTAGTGIGILARLLRFSRIENVSISDFDTGLALASVSDFNVFDSLRIRDCDTYGVDLAIFVDETGAALLTPNGQCNSNRFVNCDVMLNSRDSGDTAYGIYVHGNAVGTIIRDSQFHNFDTSTYAAILVNADIGDFTNTVVDNNYFEGNYYACRVNNPSASDAGNVTFTNNYVTQIDNAGGSGNVGFITNCSSSGLISGVWVSGNHFTNPNTSAPYNTGTGISIHSGTREVFLAANHFTNMVTDEVAFGSTAVTYTRNQDGIMYVSDQIRLGDGADADFAVVFDTSTLNGTLTYLGASAVNDFQFNQPLRVPTLRNVAATAKTIASGVLTPDQGYHTVTGEGGVADDLATITWSGVLDGTHLYLRPTSDTVDITVKHGTGNIYLTGAADLVMDKLEDTIHLLFNGTSWVQVGGGNNRA